MKTFLVAILFASFFFASGWFFRSLFTNTTIVEQTFNKVNTDQTVNKPLEKYSIESLSRSEIPAGKITVTDIIQENEKFDSYKFMYDFLPTLEVSETKTTTGLINMPKGDNKKPLVLMIRGWAPQENYTHGVGTWRASEFFADNGFITVAPDFLGYADSDENSADIFETRFQTYTTVLSLIESLDQISLWDGENLFFWAHSNGGQILLTTLAVTEKDYPTTLWAPVSVFFPYSVLYYTNESSDRGKLIRGELSKFEELYDPDKFSFDFYLDKIQAPLQIHQGTNDSSVPARWNNDLTQKLRTLEKEVNYYVYHGADHNLRPDWNTVVQRDLNFFNQHLK